MLSYNNSHLSTNAVELYQFCVCFIVYIPIGIHNKLFNILLQRFLGICSDIET